MKKVVLVIVALILAIALTSCGAGSDTTADTQQASGENQAADQNTAGTTTNNAATPQTAAKDDKLPRKIEDLNETPQYFQDAVKDKEPILLMLYSKDRTSQELMKDVKTLYEDEKYSGIVKFLILEMREDEETVDLARAFGVGYIPYTAIINREGKIVFEKTGFVDKEVLEQALYNATNK